MTNKDETKERDPRGRAAFVPTDDQRETVKVLKALGKTQEVIAAAIDISVPTLVKFFSLDMEVAQAKVTREISMALYRSAIGGNVSAQKTLALQLDAVVPQLKGRKIPESEKAKEAKLGKKDQAQKDAQEVPEGWGDVLKTDNSLN